MVDSCIIQGVKTYLVSLAIFILTACGGTPPLPATFATATPQLAAEVIGGGVQSTPLPVALTAWQSPDGRIALQVPQGWTLETHTEAGRGLWIWNAPGQRGLLSLLLIGTPKPLSSTDLIDLVDATLQQLAATSTQAPVVDASGSVVVDASGSGINREGVAVPLWIRVSIRQFEDSVAVVVLSVPAEERTLYQAFVEPVQRSLSIAPLPTATPLPTTTPAPRTFDRFDADEGRWFVGDDVRRAMTIQDGVYRMYLRMTDSYYLSAPAEEPRADQRIQVTARFEGAARIGTALRFQQRADSTRDYVVCWISPLQRFGCFRSEADQWVALQDVTESVVIVPDGDNRIDFAVQGTSYTLMVNGVVLTQFEYDSEAIGVPGLYVETFDVAAGGVFDDVETS